MVRADGRPFVRDAIVAAVLLAGLSGLPYGVQFRPLQIPGYILLVGFGTFGGAIGPEALFPVTFGIYLLSLGVVGAIAVRAVRRRIPDDYSASWRRGMAGAFGVLGALSLLFTGVAFSGTQMDAVVLTGISALLFLSLAGWFAGVLTVNVGRAGN